MGVQTSYSQSSTYISCSKHWYWKYVEKYDSEKEGASTYFGSAFDAAVSAMLKGQTDYLKIFSDRFFSSIDRKKQILPIFDNSVIAYSNYDFNEHVIDADGIVTMEGWAKELGLEKYAKDPIAIFKKVIAIKKSPYKTLKENELRYFSRCCWLSLKKKGEILLEAFKEQFVPQIEEVIEIQKYAFLKDEETGDAISGFIDFVLKLKGYDKPIIIDLKTSAQAYKQDQIENSDQLTLYVALEGHNYNTNLVGYVVCVKNIKVEPEHVCTKCSNIKIGRWKTCNNMVEGVRCNGDWQERKKLVPEIQVLIQEKSDDQMKDILLDQGNIIEAMKNRIVYKNTSKCANWYGSRCIYYNLCHNGGDATGLRKRS